MKSRWVEHNGKRIFIADFSNFGTDAAALAAECGEIVRELRNEQPKSVRSVSSVEGTVATPAVLNAFKNLLGVSNQYVVRRGVVGMSGARRAFIDIINRFTGGTRFVTFDTLEEALDWIATQ